MTSIKTADNDDLPGIGDPMPDTDAPPARIGVLIVNLGTPDGTDYFSVRRYLKEFLSDPRVIETPKLIWWPILNGIILTVRPTKAGKAYRSVWNEERDESPLRTITRNQFKRLNQTLEGLSDRVIVDWAMRYGQPSIASKIKSLTDLGCDRILLFPLYPQYSATTTATVNDKAFLALKHMRNQPAIRTVPNYHDDPVYIDALAKSIENHLASIDWTPEIILCSYHGLPKTYVEKGDPYQKQCYRTTDLLKARLGALGDKVRCTFQSRFGPAEWLRPYTDETIEALARTGTRNMLVLAPGFSADCIETLEELGDEAREIFEDNGGENFNVIPCLNDSDDSIALLESIVRRELSGWI